MILASLSLAFACTESDETLFDRTEDHLSEPVEIVVQERDPSLPAEPTRIGEISPSAVQGSEFIQPDDFIGRGYKIGNTILGDPENVSIPVFQRLQLNAAHPAYFVNKSLLKTEPNFFAYTTDQEYEAKSNLTKTVSSGFKLNLGLFSIGRKKTMEKSFSTYDYQRSQDAYGELNIEFRRALYGLETSSLVNKRIAGEYLNPDFVELLYGLTIDELMAQYGTFVITGYYIGGKASALYLGYEYSSREATERTSGLESEIGASFSWTGSDANGNLSFGNKNSCSTDLKTRFQSVYMTLKTIGGKPSFVVSLSAQNIRDVGLDLSVWLASLADTNYQTLIGMQDGGLQPLSDFILEENFRQRIQKTHLGTVKTDQLQIPSIQVVQAKENVALGAMQAAYSVLNTRHHDRLLLDGKNTRKVSTTSSGGGDFQIPGIGIELASLPSIETGRRSKYFGLRITVNSEIKNVASLRFITPSLFDCDFVLPNWDESKMVKFVNSKTHMVYLLNQTEKYALAFPDDGYIVDVYGIRTWVENMPSVVLSMTALENDYTIYGL